MTVERPGTALVLRIFVPFAAGYFLSYVFRNVNAVLAPDLSADLQLTAADLGLLTSTYFLAFAAFQLPLGILLDRFGPRRVESALLLLAAAGAWLFAVSGGVGELLAGRALIGLGVSACLMAAFKAHVLWFSSQFLPLANGCIMAAGGLGALTATVPVEFALTLTDWRGVFSVLAGLALLVSALLFTVSPEQQRGGASTTLGAQVRGVAGVFASPIFWRIAPLCTLSQASFLAIQGLWAGPWLKDVAGLERGAVAGHLFAMTTAMVAGFLIMGALAERLGRVGIKPMTVAATGMLVFMLAQATLVLELVPVPLPVWLVFGFFGTTGILCYASLSQSFPVELAGRVNTSLNLLVFVTAFAAQWLIGIIVNRFSLDGGAYGPQGYALGFGLMLALQAICYLWFLIAGRRVSA